MLSSMLEKARADEPLWLPELRESFLADPASRPLYLRLTLHDGSVRDFPCALPLWNNEEERRFAAEFLYASVNNILAVCSGRELRLFFDTSDAGLCHLFESLDAVFQLHEANRRGYGKVISVAMNISGGAFRFAKSDLSVYMPLPETAAKTAPAPLDEKLRALCAKASGLALCGVDVGGTDIKLALSDGERLVCTKEYDWNPAACATAEEITGPILWLTRLMRACLAYARAPLADALGEALHASLSRDAPLEQIMQAVEAAEAACGEKIAVLDGVGVSFPDIVIADRILGGETPKTDGIRRNAAVCYETEFATITGLKDALLLLCKPGGRVRIVNDGNMAAFTAAAELAHSEDAPLLSEGVLAHSLGTDLGTGWLTAEGTIPDLPLELYAAILDLGSFRSRAYPPTDLRSTRNANSGLPVAQRYMGQSAAYRLAQKRKSALLDGFTEWKDGEVRIMTEPRDMRKACLEHLMQRAEAGDPDAEAVFRDIGENLSVAVREMEYLLHPASGSRYLFGRFVNRPAVCRLLEEGFHRGAPGLRLLPSGEKLSRTPLMRALARAPGMTVAQFGQSVGSIYYVLT